MLLHSARVQLSRHWQALKACTLLLCVAVAMSPNSNAKRYLPDCFDQTCGFPGEGPKTTLDSSDDIGPSLTPTQEMRACVMTRRRTRCEKWENEVCRVCDKVMEHRQSGRICVKCRAWACTAPCEQALVDMCCCRMSGVASHVPKSRAHSQGISGSADESSQTLTQDKQWVTDVQKSEQQEGVRGDQPHSCERVAHRIAPQEIEPMKMMKWQQRARRLTKGSRC